MAAWRSSNPVCVSSLGAQPLHKAPQIRPATPHSNASENFSLSAELLRDLGLDPRHPPRRHQAVCERCTAITPAA